MSYAKHVGLNLITGIITMQIYMVRSYFIDVQKFNNRLKMSKRNLEKPEGAGITLNLSYGSLICLYCVYLQ